MSGVQNNNDSSSANDELELLKQCKLSMEDGNFNDVLDKSESLLSAIDNRRKEDKHSDEENNLKINLYALRAQCYIQLNDYERVIETVKKGKLHKSLHAYALYRLERYEQSKEIIQSSTKEEEIGLLGEHVLAQSLFHLLGTNKSIETYRKIIKQLSASSNDRNEDDDDDGQIIEAYTNLLAAISINATPYISNNEYEEGITQPVQDILNKKNSDNTDDYPYDLSYNLATWKLITGGVPNRNHWRSTLEKAKKGCVKNHLNEYLRYQQQSDKSDDAQLSLTKAKDKDLLPIQNNLLWSQSYWHDYNDCEVDTASFQKSYKKMLKQNVPPNVASVIDFNITLLQSSPSSTNANKKVLENMSSKPDPNWKGLQKRLYWYNRAILQLQCNVINGCRTSLESLSKLTHQPSSPSSKKKNKKGAANIQSIGIHQPVPSKADSLWWETRIDVLKAYCLRVENKHLEATQLLRDRLDTLKSYQGPPSSSYIIDHAISYASIQAFVLQRKTDENNDIDDTNLVENIGTLLQDLPQSMQAKSGVVATLASNYHEQKKFTDAQRLLKDTGDELVLADFELSQGNYNEAVSLYQKKIDEGSSANEQQDKLVLYAKLVQALSFVDPKRASEIWSKFLADNTDAAEVLDQYNNNCEINAEELEQRELPRTLMTSLQRNNALELERGNNSKNQSDSNNNKKSRKAVLRQRSQKRDKYLKDLEAKGLYRFDRPTKPDPERWVPKYERMHSRRRYRKGGGDHKGAQGGVSEKDAAKLDVAARAAARKNGDYSLDGPSTAHMTVASGSGNTKRKGGRRR